MKIASWNVNSLRARFSHVIDWLSEFDPDILLLQELKCQQEDFVANNFTSSFNELGYDYVEVYGQKSYNGVAIISKLPLNNVIRGIPNFADDNARYIEAQIANTSTKVASIYCVNGESLDSEKFRYKESFFSALLDYSINLQQQRQSMVLGGDFNIALTQHDTFRDDNSELRKRILFSPKEHQWLNTLLNEFWFDSYRMLYPHSSGYTWWDYRAGRFQNDQGWRIDYNLLSADLADKIIDAGVDRTPRGWEKPSDHTPVWVDIDIDIDALVDANTYNKTLG
jgi:exodeoxyribonuclease-3